MAAWIELTAAIVISIYGWFQHQSQVPLLVAGAFCLMGIAFSLHRSTPNIIPFFIGLAAVLSAAGWTWDLYEKVLPYDEITHSLATFTVSLVSGWLFFYFRQALFRAHSWILAILMVSVGITIGVAWELAEYFIILSPKQMTLSDTLVDLLVDSFGALLSVPIMAWILKETASQAPA